MLIKIKYFLALCLMRFFQIFPINKGKIVFSSFHGSYYNDAPRVISESLKEEKVKIVWIVRKDKRQEIPNYVKCIKPNSISQVFQLATSGIWIDNSRKDYWVRKKKHQLYIQTWHGGVCIKKVEKDVESCLPEIYVKAAKNDSRMANYFISEAEWRTKNFLNSFWYNGNIIKGYISRNNNVDETEINKKN